MSSELYLNWSPYKKDVQCHPLYFVAMSPLLLISACSGSPDRGIFHDPDSSIIARECGISEQMVFVDDKFRNAFKYKVIAVSPNIENNKTEAIPCLRKAAAAHGMAFSVIDHVE